MTQNEAKTRLVNESSSTMGSSTGPTPDSETPTEDSKAKMLGWVPDGVLLPLCIVGIYTCYFTYGYLQEEIIAVEKLNPILPLFCQYLFAVFVGSSLNYLMDRHETPKPAFLTTRELKIGVLNNLTMMSSNYALTYVDYPTQALVKSSKILPVMLMGIIRGTYNHPLYKYICATVITLGIILFNVAKLGNKVTDLTFSMTGSMLLLLSLLFDGLVGTETDKDKHSNQSHNPFKLMTGSNIVGLLSSSSIIFMEYMSSGTNPLSQITLGNISGLVLIAAAGSMGQIFIYVTINRFDCFLLSIVNTSRKFFSILLSIIWFSHKLTNLHWVAIALVISAIITDVVLSQIEKRKKKLTKEGGTKTKKE